VSARWPGDAYLFGRTVRDLLESARSLYRTDRSIRALNLTLLILNFRAGLSLTRPRRPARWLETVDTGA
jgi:hypothetical protein